MIETTSIFSIPLHHIENTAQLERVFRKMLQEEKTHVVTTPNPEILLAARAHPPYAQVLRAADLSLPDGVGLSLVTLLRRGRRMRRYPGIDAGEMLLRLASERRTAVLFLGGRNGSAISAAERLTRESYTNKIYAAADNVEVSSQGEIPDPKEEKRIDAAIAQTKPEIIFVGLGAPKQEQWMIRHKDAFLSVRIMIGVGGAFDVWSARLQRAPKIFQALGLEWLWRLALEPGRLLRVLRAVFLFPLFALTQRRHDT